MWDFLDNMFQLLRDPVILGCFIVAVFLILVLL